MENGEAVTHDDFYYVGYMYTSNIGRSIQPVFFRRRRHDDIGRCCAHYFSIAGCRMRYAMPRLRSVSGDPAMVDEMHMHMFAVGTQQYDRS